MKAEKEMKVFPIETTEHYINKRDGNIWFAAI